MIVRRDNYEAVISEFIPDGVYGLDTESTGLFEDDCLFSLILSNERDNYYFNFIEYPDIDPNYVLPRQQVFTLLKKRVFSNRNSTWGISNAKFDMRMVAKEQLEIQGDIHCTYAVERLIRNDYIGEAYGLEHQAKRRGMQKSDAVEEYISKHKLYTKIQIPGKKKVFIKKHFDKVPFEIISAYGEKDGYLHRAITLSQIKELKEMDAPKKEPLPSIMPVFENEKRLTKTCFRMERTGIKIDKPFVAKALEYEMGLINQYQKEFLDFTGEHFSDSNKPLQKIFDRLGEKYPLTEKGNASFAAEALEDMETPLANIINKIRYHDKRAGTYYSSFLFYAGDGDIIHADARQAGTTHGRMSYRDPNLQNIPKEDEEEDLLIPYHVRESFVPRPGKLFYSKDYEQMELRMMMDYAGEKGVIKQMMDGVDGHQATANEVGITRKQAKTLNFALAYGVGLDKLAKMLGCSRKEASEIKQEFFGKLWRLEQFFRQCARGAEIRGFCFNWYGRRCHLNNKDFSYRIPNHIISGGCADVVKIAMNRIDDLLLEKKVPFDMLLQVHDELIFELDPKYEEMIEPIGEIMENVYKARNGIKLTTSTAHSFKSWGKRDLIEGRYEG